MSTTVALRPQAGAPALQMNEHDLMNVLRNSLYPGAADESIKLVVGYCKASGLDPMQKPVHIVPMWDSDARVTRDVVMPGIGLYRTQAARSGQFAGVSEPEFGPDVAENIGGVQITYPAWCRVTVRRQLPSGQIAEFVAVERWKENYAIKGGKERSIAPNSMWSRRPYAQLAKCAEAQALRKAFPEVGAAPTAEEMEGRVIEAEVISHEPRQPTRPTPPPPDTAALEQLREAAMEGSAALETAWKALTKEQRKSLAGELGALKEQAAAADDMPPLHDLPNTED
jgi:phage recombination protein Bet